MTDNGSLVSEHTIQDEPGMALTFADSASRDHELRKIDPDIRVKIAQFVDRTNRVIG